MDLDDEDLSVLEYARLHELSIDYTHEPDMQDLELPTTEDFQSDLGNMTDQPLPDISTDHTKERLTMTKDAALLLRDVCLRPPPEPIDPTQIEENHKRFAHLKQEVPILRSDHELDMRNFGNTDIPKFDCLTIQPERVDQEKDEGLEWTSSYLAYPEKCDARVKAEKLTISKDVLLLLQNSIRDCFTKEDCEQIKADSLQYRRNPALEPVTPPLLPITPPITPYVPSSPANHIELPSESGDSNYEEMKELENRIMKEDGFLLPPENESGSQGSDQMLLDDSGMAILSDPNDYTGLTPVSAPKRKLQDLKVEGPLTPPLLSGSAEKRLKTVSFPEMLHEYIPELPSSYEDGNDILSAEDSFAPFFTQVAPLVEEVNRNIENEKLSEVDTTRRVDVPKLDFALPVAPWDEFTNRSKDRHASAEKEREAHMKFILRIKRDLLKSTPIWHGVTALERALQWSPFPSEFAKANTQEELEPDELLPKLMEELSMGDNADSSSLVWKPEGLRLLDDDEDDEEDLEPAEFSDDEDKDMDTLIRKRKLEIVEKDQELLRQSGLKKVKGTMKKPEAPKENRVKETYPAVPEPVKLPSDGDLMFGGFSASNALHQFMATRGKEMKPMDTRASPNDRHPSISKAVVPEPPSRTRQLDQRGSPEKTPTKPNDSKKPVKQATLPPLPDRLPPASFIFSSQLLSQHRLVRLLTKHYEDADISDRDFSLAHSPSAEADLILSPSTGLILTTLQHIKQRALPGQPEKGGIRHRIQHLQTRYERLILLVSQGLVDEEEEDAIIDARDTAELQGLETFASKLEADVMVKCIPGGEEALARSVVVEMAQWGIPHVEDENELFKPMGEETHWELFLRRAGLNPYAAQNILHALKRKMQITLSGPGQQRTIDVLGLSAFVLMDKEERVQRFQVLMGGRRVLEKVSGVLDKRWVSAADGFQGLD